MTLLHPEYLWGLFALAIPIIIHLFNFRKFQKIYFSDIQLLKEVQLETKSKSKLKHLIILALRLLAITALVLAFCQPYIPVNKEQIHSDNVISIYIDNSHSMDSKGTNGYRLDVAIEQAEQIINGYGTTDQFQIITNDFEGRHQRLYNKQEAIQLLDEIKATFNSKNISEVYTRQKELMANESANKNIFWLSDFQKNNVDISSIKVDSSIFINCLPLSNDHVDNLYVDSIWFDSPMRKSAQEDKVYVKVNSNHSTEIDFKIQLDINGENEAFVNYTISPDQSLICEVPYSVHTNGIQNATIEISDYPNANLTFDDRFFFSYDIQPIIKVLHLYQGVQQNDSSGYFGVLYGKNKDFYFKNENIGQFDFSTLKTFDLVILDNLNSISNGLKSELVNYFTNGGSLCVFPSENMDISSYNMLLSELSSQSYSPKITEISKSSVLNSEHPIYQGIFDEIPKNLDLPLTQVYYPIQSTSMSTTSNLITYQNGKPFLTFSQSKKGSLVLCSSPIDPNYSNWVKHALFVPTMLRIAEFSQSKSNYYNIVGRDLQINAPGSISHTDIVNIGSLEGDFSFVPEIKLTNQSNSFIIHDQIKNAGHYLISVNNEIVDGLGFNFDRKESVMDFYNGTELEELLANSELNGFFQIIEGTDSSQGIILEAPINGKKYWWNFILTALILLGLEILVYRVFN
ncbi:MAG: BatA domain-containing protein [Flavobacteriales bacterium]|nr:BatA domain-containing protein [Flavobacteriales bacterium]